jgi:hypothetical protein
VDINKKFYIFYDKFQVKIEFSEKIKTNVVHMWQESICLKIEEVLKQTTKDLASISLISVKSFYSENCYVFKWNKVW